MQNGQEKLRKRHARGPRVEVARWKPPKKFAAWVRAYSITALAESINVSRRAIHGWLRGDIAPCEDNIRRIIVLSKFSPAGVGPLDYEDIHGSAGDP